MPNRGRIPTIFIASAILLCTAGLSTALSQNSKSKNSEQSNSNLRVEPQVKMAKSPVRNLGKDAKEFEILAEQFVRQKKIPGMAIALVQDGKVLSARGYGITDTRNPQAIKPDTVFRLASLSKAFAATITGILVEEQALEWDTPIAKQLPAFKLRDFQRSQQVTVSDVLSHQVGLGKNTFDRDLESNVPYPLLAERLSNAPLTCSPSECYGYQNIAFSLIGDMVFAVTGDFYTHQVESKIFTPLNMTNATYGRDGLMANSNWAKPHSYSGKAWVSSTPNENYYHVPPAAGVNASIQDMSLWLNAQLGHRQDVLSASLLTKTHTPQVNTPGELRSSGWRHDRLSKASYALGWRVFTYQGQKLVFHGGAVRGYRSLIAFLPDQDTGIVVLWNSESSAPSAFLPAWIDRALGINNTDWIGIKDGSADSETTGQD
jgi:beta-lactamase class C